jgi:hypothetical protein
LAVAAAPHAVVDYYVSVTQRPRHSSGG